MVTRSTVDNGISFGSVIRTGYLLSGTRCRVDCQTINAGVPWVKVSCWSQQEASLISNYLRIHLRHDVTTGSYCARVVRLLASTILTRTPTIVSSPNHAVVIAVIISFYGYLSPVKFPRGLWDDAFKSGLPCKEHAQHAFSLQSINVMAARSHPGDNTHTGGPKRVTNRLNTSTVY